MIAQRPSGGLLHAPVANPSCTPRFRLVRVLPLANRGWQSNRGYPLGTTMIYTHVLNRGGRGVRSPADGLARPLDER